MTDKILRIENEEEITDIIINRCDGTGYQLYLDELCFEPAPPKDWAQQMKDLEERNIRLSRFIMDWLGRELDIFPEGALSLDDILEKAPLKSWRPACYNYSELVEGCAQIPFTDKPECRRCPYHEVKE